MYLECISDSSKKYYAKPVMVLNISGDSTQNFSDEEILKKFSEDDETEAIVIVGSDPMDKVDALRSFMFSARKFFSPNSRPRIIIYTKYFEDELNTKYWNGVKCELLYYGNTFLKYGRSFKTDKKAYFNNFLGIKLLGSSQSVICYTKLQHE